jgi:cyclophilin family peptidyl-prolyl cis-trans isomerase
MKLGLILIPVLGFVLLAACGDDGDNGDTPQSTATAAETPLDETPDGGTPTVATTPSASFSEACQPSDERQWPEPPEQIIDTSKTYVATISTSKGDIVVELDSSRVVTTNNFVFLACTGYYNGLTFHRVADDPPVIQGGDPTGSGSGGPGYGIVGEFEGAVFDTGVIGMARTADPNSAGSQFFIMTGPAPHLNDQYAAFGRVTSGQEVADEVVIGDLIDSITIQEQ